MTPLKNISAIYFDGRSSRAQPVQLQIVSQDLHLTGDNLALVIPTKNIMWPERTRHGTRVAHFDNGASIQCSNAEIWDAWRKQSGHAESWVVQSQQSWRLVLLSVVVLIAFIFALQRWGIPLAARTAVHLIPTSVDEFLGKNSLETIDNFLMKPSQLSLADQASLRTAFEKAALALPSVKRSSWKLHFRKSNIGPNAFALPGGDMVMTDELIELVKRDEQIIIGVLAHELGHVQERHGLRMLIQVTGLGAIASVLLGDFSTVLAGVPTLLGQASYSREAEQEADAFSASFLKAAKISPLVMVELFEKLSQYKVKENAPSKGDSKEMEADKGQKKSSETEKPKEMQDKNSWLGIAFSSHPADAQRIDFFKKAALTP